MSPQFQHSIIISPVDKLDDNIIKEVSTQVGTIFDCSTEVMPLVENISFAFDEARSQYNSTAILNKLSDIIPKTATKILAITKADLFIPILTYVYGEAQLGGKACVISTNRLKEISSSLHSEQTFLDRVAKEAIHELGHTFNIHHCDNPACIMHYCRCIEDVDRKSDQFCRYCSILLADEKKKLANN